MVIRIGAALLGVVVLALALVISVGTVILVPLGMLITWYVMRRRGRSLTGFQTWLAGVLPFGTIVIVGLIVALLGPLHANFDEFDRAVAEAEKHPQEQPAFLRQLGAPPPVPLPPSVAGPLSRIGLVIGLEMWCVFTGTLGWGGVSLLVFGVRGPRPPQADPTLAALP